MDCLNFPSDQNDFGEVINISVPIKEKNHTEINCFLHNLTC